MELKPVCANEDILCIADVLTRGWETPVEVKPAVNEIPDCLPCLLNDWDDEYPN